LLGYALLVPALLLAGAGMMLFLISDPKRRTAACHRMVASVAWSGAEQVLDVGCGNGLVLLTAAKHLHAHKGKATGIDIWHAIAGRQTLEKLRQNAEIENVVNRIEFREADARQIPFGDAAFDVVFASLSLHHAGTRADRTRVLAEMKRVLKPGGVILVYDMFPVTNEATRTLGQLGVTEIQYLSGSLLRVLRAQTTAT
jgi:ubiquinone/menaquinone biosynthesis C-methylase UbiE